MDTELTDEHQRIIDKITDEGTHIFAAKTMPDGSLAWVQNFAFTFGLCYDVDEFGIGGRFCFEHATTAILALWAYEGGRFEIPSDALRVKGKFKKTDERLIVTSHYWPDDHEECKRLQKANSEAV